MSIASSASLGTPYWKTMGIPNDQGFFFHLRDDCHLSLHYTKIGVSGIHSQHLQHNRSGIGKRYLPSKCAFLTRITQRDFLLYLAIPDHTRNDLDLVRIPEPTGLCGTSSTHSDSSPYSQFLACRGTDIWRWDEQLHDKTMDLQQDSLTQHLLPGD
jgi:hypothetical protein